MIQWCSYSQSVTQHHSVCMPWGEKAARLCKSSCCKSWSNQTQWHMAWLCLCGQHIVIAWPCPSFYTCTVCTHVHMWNQLRHRYMLCEWAGNITGGFTAIRIVDCDYSLIAVVAIGCCSWLSNLQNPSISQLGEPAYITCCIAHTCMHIYTQWHVHVHVSLCVYV
jgi:hypothetical protein